MEENTEEPDVSVGVALLGVILTVMIFVSLQHDKWNYAYYNLVLLLALVLGTGVVRKL